MREGGEGPREQERGDSSFEEKQFFTPREVAEVTCARDQTWLSWH